MSANPLTENHLAQINQGLDQVNVALQQIDMAKRAGLDVSAQEQQANDTRDKLLQLKNVYFPGR